MEGLNLAKLKDVIIQFACNHCHEILKMTAADLLEAGTEGEPYCDCDKGEPGDLEVINVLIWSKYF
jgi:hypothetical protein